MAVHQAGSVEALLKLNTSGFDTSITESVGKVESFVKTMEKLGTSSEKFTKGFKNIQEELSLLDDAINHITADAKKFESFNKMANGMNALVKAAQSFNKEGGITITTFSTMGNAIRSFMNNLGGVDVKLTQVVAAEEKVTTASAQLERALMMPFANFGTGYQNYLSQINQVQASLNKTKTSADSVSNSTKTMSSSISSASSSASTANQRFNGLTQSLGALRTMVSMVGSMFLYNFAHNMMISVQNTVKAKSEMESFLSTMGMTGGQVDSFNAALDRTVERFQRVNKYNIGETVANIGLEFNLSAKEMEKAMSVTSMITSEYLRAGRNADEAALAVKDIMQGQFQRLSRETGVKQENLKEAGWSGDTSDVLGLMDALEKVAKARHWDTFAEKASSLNDIVLITQNRLSEWATDISEGVVPIVTGAFNLLVVGIDGVTKLFTGLGSALHLPDWTGTALLIGGVVTALAGLVTSTITARTGLGLLDIAHKGLGQSILATIFNIRAEEMENQKATTIIAGRVLGLNAETVAQNGLKAGIVESMVVERAEQVAKETSIALSGEKTASISAEALATRTGISVEQAKVILQNQDNLLQMRSITLLTAKALGLEAETVASSGLLGALGKQTAQRLVDIGLIKEETVAEMGLNTARTLGIATIGLYVGALVGLALVIAPLIIQMQEACDTMKEFNTLVSDGDNVIKDARSSVQSLTEKQEDLTKKLSEAKQGSAEYSQIQQELRNVNADLTYANYHLRDSIEAVEMVRSRQSSFDQQKQEMEIDGQRRLAEQLHQAGLEYSTASQYANEYYTTVSEGIKKINDVAGYRKYDEERTLQGTQHIIDSYDGKGFDPEYVAQKTSEYAKLHSDLQDHYEQMMLSQDLVGKLEGGAKWMGDHVQIWMKDFEVAWDTQNWADIGSHIGDSVKALFRLNGIAGLFDESGLSGMISQWLGEDWAELSGIPQRISDAFSGLDKWITDGLNQINNIDIGKILSDWWNGLFSGGDGKSKGAMGGIAKNIDMSWIREALTQGLTDLGDWFNTMDWSFLGGGLINKILGLDENTDIGVLLGEKLASAQEYIQGFVDYISNGIANLPNTILTHLNNIGVNISNFSTNMLNWGIQSGSNFVNNLVNTFSRLPSQIWSHLNKVGHYILEQGIVWVANARSKGQELVNSLVNKVAELPQKVYNEFMKVGQRIRDAIDSVVQAAKEFGNRIKEAVLNALKIFSPGIIQQKIAQEFADIPSRISEQNANAEAHASSFGQSIVDGMNTQLPILQQQAKAMTDAMNISTDSQAIDFSGQFVGDYQADANTVTGLNQSMTTNTITTFGLMGDTVNSTIDGMSSNLQNSYLNMNTTQTTALTTMQSNNTNAYNKLQTTTTTSLNNMRNTTQNVTLQMVNAWDHMKDNIIHSADQLKSQSTAHFNTLSDHIGTFYRKLQNPSMWGAGDKVPTRYYNSARGNRGKTAVKRAFGISAPRKGYAGGYSPDNLPETASIRKIRQMVGYSPIFNGMDLDQEVDVAQFLSMLGGSFGWNDWHPNHYNRIKSTSGEWKMRGPQIMHRIDTGETFQVKEFYDSQPKISFASFQHMAEALFSAIPYDFYWNSDKYGSWQAALQAGSCNCWDGAHAILALANTCGFSGTIEHGTWNGLGHVYAVINGKKMDTTGWQNRRDWNGVSAGSPSNMSGLGGTTLNVNIDMSNSTFNGEDDFRNKMKDIAQEVLREEVNASITVGI